jgi:membrane fusion protein, multidrug efflux system
MKNKSFKSIIYTAICFLLFSCSTSDKKNLEKEKKSVRTVEMTEVKSLHPKKQIVLPGELKPWEKIDFYPKVKSFVKEILVDRGSVVKKGQLLIILEAPELKSQLAREEAGLHENQAKFAASKAHYQRLVQTSKTPGAVSPNELDIAQSRMLADSSNIFSSRASISSITEIINYLRIVAPFDGIITERNVHPGALVGAGGSEDSFPMLKIEHSDKLRLTLAIPEVYAAEMENGSKVTFSVSSYPEKIFEGVLRRNSQSINENIRSMFVEFDVQNKNLELKPGMYADVSLPIQRKSASLFVPVSSVVNSTEKVFVIKIDSNTAHWIGVKTGNVIGSEVEVFGEGIKAGDLIVNKASEEIRNGEKIEAGRSIEKPVVMGNQ